MKRSVHKPRKKPKMGYQCPVCGKFTSKLIDLARHMISASPWWMEHNEWIEKRCEKIPPKFYGKGGLKLLAKCLGKFVKKTALAPAIPPLEHPIIGRKRRYRRRSRH